MQARRQPRAPPASPGAIDNNRERLVLCVTSLVGHRVTAKLRNNAIYEGLFHSCALDSDYSITLKYARRLPSEPTSRSSEVIATFVIPGKDFLQVSASDLPPVSCMGEELVTSGFTGKGFKTDGEISKRKQEFGAGRELVPWADGGATPVNVGGGLEDGGSADPNWDQFAANEKLYGVSSTFDEEMYTTRLNKDAIPKEKREKADRIAREIEGDRHFSHGDVDDRVDAENDEESKFSSVSRKDTWTKSSEQSREARQAFSGGAAAGSSAPLAQLPPNANDRNADALASLAQDGFRTNKRGMISEMKRINALNLEPTLPKMDEGNRNARINYKENQARNASRPTQQAGDLKTEFQQSLEQIRKQSDSQQQKKQAANPDAQQTRPGGMHAGALAAVQAGSGGQDWSHQGGGHQKGLMLPHGALGQQGGGQQGQPGYPAAQGGDQSRHRQQQGPSPGGSFSNLNAGAKEFVFNPQAGEFTPSSGTTNNPSGKTVASKQQGSVASAPQFNMQKGPLIRKNLTEILEPFFQEARKHSPDSLKPDWPDAKGLSYHEILGQPSAAGRPQLPGPMGMVAPGGPCHSAGLGPGPCLSGPCGGAGPCGGHPSVSSQGGPCQALGAGGVPVPGGGPQSGPCQGGWPGQGPGAPGPPQGQGPCLGGGPGDGAGPGGAGPGCQGPAGGSGAGIGPGAMGPGDPRQQGIAPQLAMAPNGAQFVVANAPGPGPGPGGPMGAGGPPQMFQQMYAAGPGPGQPGAAGPGGNMPPQAQQQVVFGQQTMMAQQPSVAVPMQMVGAQGGQNPQGMGNMAAMPKFGGQQQMVVMAPAMMLAPGQPGMGPGSCVGGPGACGAFQMPGGFVPQMQSGPGQPGPGPQGGPGQQGQQGGGPNQGDGSAQQGNPSLMAQHMYAARQQGT